MSRLTAAALILLLACAAADGAPAPLPRVKVQAEQPRFPRLKANLEERGLSVIDVYRADAVSWVVRFTTTRGACMSGIRGKVFSSRIEARDREAALEILLQRCCEEDEKMARKLKALGFTP